MLSASCYVWDFANNKPSRASSSSDQPCPSGGGCCNPGDICVGNFMCKHKDIETDPDRPQYYISACTDPDYAASSCVKTCSRYVRTGVVYNATSDLWACCGTVGNTALKNSTTCSTPTDDTFALVSPEDLPVIGVAGSGSTSPSSSVSASSSTPASSSSTATSTASGQSPSPTSSTPGGGLSSGAEVGLGVGLGLGIALLIAVVAFFVLRKRKRSKAATAHPLPAETHTVKPDSYFHPPKQDIPPSYGSYISNPSQNQEFSWSAATQSELSGCTSRVTELPTSQPQPRVELP